MRRLLASDVWSPAFAGRPHPYYSCQKRLGRHESCGGIHIQVPAADHAVTAQILAYLASPNGPTAARFRDTSPDLKAATLEIAKAQTKLSGTERGLRRGPNFDS